MYLTIFSHDLTMIKQGHSLSGAYSTLTYAQLSIGGYGTNNVLLGDLYTFGCPHIGRGEFVRAVGKTFVDPQTSASLAQRIVNDGDYVPKVPHSWRTAEDPFIHVDLAYKIYPTKAPELLPSEIGTCLKLEWPTHISPHYELQLMDVRD